MTALVSTWDAGADGRGRSRLRRWLGRRTTTGTFIPEIDGLRFPAIASVVLGHLCAYFVALPHARVVRSAADSVVLDVATHAGLGVLVFFVISGFVLGLPFAREQLAEGPRVDRGAYYMRRLTRLE